MSLIAATGCNVPSQAQLPEFPGLCGSSAGAEYWPIPCGGSHTEWQRKLFLTISNLISITNQKLSGILWWKRRKIKPQLITPRLCWSENCLESVSSTKSLWSLQWLQKTSWMFVDGEMKNVLPADKATAFLKKHLLMWFHNLVLVQNLRLWNYFADSGIWTVS